MQVLFYFGHPSQYLFLKNSLSILRSKGFKCDVVIKSKDILEQLLIENDESFVNLLPEGRKSNKFGIIVGLLKRDFRLLRFIKNKRYNLFIGTDPALAQVGYFKRIPVLTVLEDDIGIIPELARITFPFTSHILTPEGCKTGKYERKTIHYRGYMKLAYLHPKYFYKTDSFLPKPYFLIRISRLDAYHDSGVNGFTIPLIKEIIRILEQKGTVYISQEGNIDESISAYELKIRTTSMQDVLANAKMLISDSQSMTMEAAMLGVPSIRFSDFAGKISVLEELEHKYSLTFGITTKSVSKLYEKLDELLAFDDLEQVFQKRRKQMLDDKIDVTSFLVWFIENYSDSVKLINNNPEYQNRFK